PFLLRRRVRGLAERLKGRPRSTTVVLSVAGFFGSLAVLVGGLWTVQLANGLEPSGLKPWAWAVVGVIGLVFVMMQTLAAMALVMLAVPETVNPRSSSDSREAKKP
ncbi:MAG: hypothetical protein KF812_11620, partial [Fimbriimonadaceae bacterium]|nr:hypothetical protein [Fimbriimonadaceae bacterium]